MEPVAGGRWPVAGGNLETQAQYPWRLNKSLLRPCNGVKQHSFYISYRYGRRTGFMDGPMRWDVLVQLLHSLPSKVYG